MNDTPFNFNEFMRKPAPKKEPVAVEPPEIAAEAPELEVQQVVVQELAADKAALAADYENLSAHAAELENAVRTAQEEAQKLRKELAEARKTLEEAQNTLQETRGALSSTQNTLTQKESELAAQLAKELDLQERNPNALALLDRDVDLPDRFPGETRDHVLEVIAAARDKAEAEGRIRRAQILEGVLVANEPNGNLAKKRAALEKFFNENHNVMTGPVQAELDRCGISYKKGAEYLLPSEILLRTY
ncbi:MAG TPA: hypothetical protein DDY72_02955 [Verrucomicrobia bacterium]|nr:hypothetical protein [Verrucomicrobiota bacterium]